MKINLSPDWKAILAQEIDKPYFKELMLAFDLENKEHKCYPPEELIFSAFNHCSFQDLKVVIIGQDPYHGEGEANGLSFSVNDDAKIPPSLQNIFKEINMDLDSIFMPTSGNLEKWAKQGVLLLNSSLTVQKDIANSHKHLKWNLFTDAVIQAISDKKENIVFLLWGNFAQKKGKGDKIDRSKHFVLESGHPSFASVHKKWFGNKHFSKTNAFLQSKGIKEIEW